MKRGRPNYHDQKKIKELILQEYEKNISAVTASDNSGINYKTVLKYYKIFDNQVIEPSESFLSRVKTIKKRTVRSMEKDITSFFAEEKKIELLKEQALKVGKIPEFEKLSRLKLKIIDQRMKTQSAKVNLIGTPTADIIIKEGETLA